jgi:hypothetical protein
MHVKYRRKIVVQILQKGGKHFELRYRVDYVILCTSVALQKKGINFD